MAASLTCLLISDTHGEFYADGGAKLFKSLPNEGIDVLLACGDITTLQHLRNAAEVLCDRFPRVLWVNGNHEFYKAGREAVEAELTELDKWWKFDWLNRKAVDIDGIVFAGATGWWGPHKDNPTQAEVHQVNRGHSGRIIDMLARELWDGRGDKTKNLGRIKAARKRSLFEENQAIAARGINDFFVIPKVLDWAYDEHKKDMTFLSEAGPAAHVVMTHLAPSNLSTPERFKEDPRCRYYWNDLHELVKHRGPQWWLHGHTHDQFDYKLGSTRIVCEPCGYPKERQGVPYTGFTFKVTL